MRKRIKWVLLLLGLVLFASSAKVLATAPGLDRQVGTVVPSKNNVTVVIPERAREVAPGVFELGNSLVGGELVEGYAFVHRQKAPAKPSGCNNDGKCQGWEDASCGDCNGGGEPDPDDSKCYGFLARDAKWKELEPYIVNPVNIRGLDGTFVTNNLATDIAKWESAAGVEILGDGSSTSDILVADLNSPDNQNEVYFADVDSPGAIAITIIWGVFGGRPSQRRLVEWDQVYDEVDYDWSSSGEVGKMDFESIASHELGHSVGLDDPYEDRCSEQTMFGYADYGEIKKRTLEAGDITGISKLYQ